jgi:methionine-S-sulfoxide reductase
MKQSVGWMLAGLVAVAGCRAANAEERSKDARASEGPSKAAASSRVGTNPGHVGYGTPLVAGPGHELAAFAAGCFWGVEDAFRKVPGVTATAVGYTGGHTKDPTYPKVCAHDTGHAETVLVEYDPKRIGYERLLRVFFQIHDPTTPNRQGPDVGDQYRSAIFTFSAKQADAARRAIAGERAKGVPVVTEVSPIGPFYLAEAYHQQYAERTGSHGCPVRGFTGDI